MPFNKKKGETLADEAYVTLEKMIVTMELKPDEIISANEISEATGIGKMPLREALKKLENAGLISIISRTGIMINDITPESFLHQFEVRCPLEDLAVQKACQNINEKEKARLLQIAEEYTKANSTDDRELAVDLDKQYHELCVACTKNSFLYYALNPLYTLARRLYFQNYYLNIQLTREVNSIEIDLMRNIAARDEEKALDTAKQLQNKTVDIMKASFNDLFK